MCSNIITGNLENICAHGRPAIIVDFEFHIIICSSALGLLSQERFLNMLLFYTKTPSFYTEILL